MRRQVTKIAPLLLVTLLCVGGVEGFYWSINRYLFNRPEPAIPATTTQKAGQSPQPAAQDEQVADYRIILQRNLFGPPPQTEKRKGAEETNLEGLEPSTLDVVLLGTIQAGGQNDDRAVILNKTDRQQDIYKQGDKVQDAVIKKIFRGKVVLSRNGEDSILDISEAAKLDSANVAAPVSVNPATRQRRVVPAPVTQPRTRRLIRPRVVRPARVVRPPRTQTPPNQENGKTQ